MKTKLFTFFFTIIVLLELFFGSFETYITWHYITKPAIVISLLLFFISNAAHIKPAIRVTTILALLCSLCGDVLLMLVTRSESFFIAGLVSFLLAHVMYIITFLKDRNNQRNSTLFILFLLLYASGLFWFIKDGLGNLLIPVVVYMTIILGMATSAYLRKGNVLDNGYFLVFIGALFFMISDSLLAINKFYSPLPFSHIGIMLTYAIAQFLIVLGILKSYKS
ncbi:lysoplasmalogenase [Kordia zhangzhouensis]|uniref:lysoplasmalogenase n=1 Tax=Kordia zhangzhouensis TaxID=1620405 RepID=UPI0006294AC7|nr:lysoplasmalogenase [Kordia zhangzhouensis]